MPASVCRRGTSATHQLLELIETGEVRHKDERRLWIAKCIPSRTDNLLCAAVAVEDALIVKSVMHHFAWEPEE